MVRKVVIAAVGAFLGAVIGQAQAENLALNRPYTWNIAPSYSLCTEPGDSTQLTDGVYNTNSDYYHATAPTVGWQGSGPIVITIDLGAVYPIEKFTYRTSAFNGVGYPAFIDTWVSDNGGTYSYGGELIANTWQNGLPDQGGTLRGEGFGVFQFVASGLHLRGRYVKLVPYRVETFHFCDEIEVFRGSFDPSTFVPSTIQLSSGFEAWTTNNRYDSIARIRMLRDIQELQRHSQAVAFATQIDSLRQQVLSAARIGFLTMEQGLPYNSLHSEIWKLNGQMNRAAGQPVFNVAWGSLYDPLHPFDTFTAATTTGQVHMAGNEQRSLAVNLSNFSDNTAATDIVFEWSASGFPLDNVDLRCVRFTEAQQRAIVASALPKVTPSSPGQWFVNLSAGVTSQLWFNFSSKNVNPGIYPAQLRITPAGSTTTTLSVKVQVHAGILPDNPSLDSSTFEYAHTGGYPMVTSTNKLPIIKLLKDHRSKSHWLHPAVFIPNPPGVRRSDGTYSTLPTFTGLNNWLNDLAASGDTTNRYYTYLAINYYENHYSGGYTRGTTQYQTGVRSFFQALADNITARGLDKSRFYFSVLDEPPYPDHWEQTGIDFINLVRQAVPEFKFWSDPAWSDPATLNEPYLAVQDVIVPALTFLTANSSLLSYYQSYIATHGKEFGTYLCSGGGLTRSPTGYFRTLAWNARKMGMTNISIWTSAACNRTNSWDDFGAESNYEMIFATPTTANSGKSLAAWRDGVQDYEYFKILDNLIAQCQTNGASASLISWAQNLSSQVVTTALAQVADGGRWGQNAAINNAFDAGRVQILDAIDILYSVAQTAGLMLCDFEPPTYTAGQSLVGQNGWVNSGPTGWGVVTPDPVSGYNQAYGAVLNGQQSAVWGTSGTGTVLPFTNGDPVFDNVTFSIQVMADTGATDLLPFVLLSNVSAGHTPVVIRFYKNGSNYDIQAYAKINNSWGYRDTGGDWIVRHKYRIDVTVDFASQKFTLYIQDLTAGSPVQSLGTWNTVIPSASQVAQAGGIGVYTYGGVLMFDDIALTVPMTATLTGIVQLQGYTGRRSDVALKLTLRKGGAVVTTKNVFPDLTGRFTIPNLEAGTYDVGLKSCVWKEYTFANQALVGTMDLGTITLAGGDNNGDNAITTADLTLVLGQMDTIGN